MKTRIHAIAGGIALLCIVTFWIATVISELFLSEAAIAAVKHAIVGAMWILIPAIAITGASGFRLGERRASELVQRKKRRMPFIALNGLLILLPAALLLNYKAAAAVFDTVFYTVQAVELLAGAVNIALMGLNLRDGLRLTGRSQRLRAEMRPS